MKEAAGEANMTVITIVLIAIVLAVGTIIVTNLMSNTGKRSACSEIGGRIVNGNTCVYKQANGVNASVQCSKNEASGEWTCPTTTSNP